MRYAVNVSRALAHSGAELPIQRNYDIGEITVGAEKFTAKAPLKVNLVLRNVGKDLLLSGDVVGEFQTECSRCLEPAKVPVKLKLQELITRTPEKDEPALVEGEFPETYFIEHEQLDIAPIIEQSVLLSLPVNPLCKPECKGLCPVCGTNWNESTCDCETGHTDPRWEALRGLLEEKSPAE